MHQRDERSGADEGVEFRFEKPLSGSDRGLISPLGLNHSKEGYWALALGGSAMAGKNNVAGATGDVMWWAFEPVVEYWMKPALDGWVQFSPFGVGASFNYLQVIGSYDFFKTGWIMRWTIRFHLRNRPNTTADKEKLQIALDLGFQQLMMFNRFKPSDFVPGAPGGDFERLLPGGFIPLRFSQ